jgi:predicted nuclease of predicted toxin-antitoxin system
MKILLDEQLKGMSLFLTSLGLEVKRTDEINLDGTKDDNIVKHAKENSFIIVTENNHMARLAELHNVGCILTDMKFKAKAVFNEIMRMEQ